MQCVFCNKKFVKRNYFTFCEACYNDGIYGKWLKENHPNYLVVESTILLNPGTQINRREQ